MDRQIKFYQIIDKVVLTILIFGWCSDIHAEQYKFVNVDAYPIGFYDDNHKPTGVAIDIFNHVMTQLGHEVDIELKIPGNRVLILIKEGKAEGIPFIRKTAAREKFLYYCKEPIYTEQVMLYIRKKDDFKFNGDLNQLKNRRIGVRLGDSYGEAFEEIEPELKIYQAGTIESLFQMLLLKRIDIVLSTQIRASRVLKSIQQEGKIIAVPKPMETIPLYVAFRKDSKLKLLRNQFDQELAKLKQNGKVQQIISNWENR